MGTHPIIEATAEINRQLLSYHREHGFRIYDSFPLVSDDPTLIFTNATITPFKRLFLEKEISHNYALVQQCLRVGGGAGNPDVARIKANYASVFEMFGSGCFGCTYHEAVRYFIDMLTHIGISIEDLHFTVPASGQFQEAVIACGVDPNRIYSLSANGYYWHAWKFGKNGLLGSGLTAIHVRPGTIVRSADDMASQPELCTEIGNLIHVFGKESNGAVKSIPNTGFEVGMGSARLAIIMEKKTLWELASFREIFAVTKATLELRAGWSLDQGFIRVVADRLRTISVLVMNNVMPGNKREGFVLRKMIRSCCELVWVETQESSSMVNIVHDFCNAFAPEYLTQVTSAVAAEEQQFRRALQKGVRVFQNGTCTDLTKLMDTYGLRQQLIPILTKTK